MNKNERMYIYIRNTAYDTPQQIADGLGGKYTAQKIEAIIRSMGLKPHLENHRSEAAEKYECECRARILEKFKNKECCRTSSAISDNAENNYEPQVVYSKNLRQKLRLLYDSGKTVAEIKKEVALTQRQIIDTLLDMELRPIYRKYSDQRRKLTKEEKEDIIECRKQGLTYKQIMQKYDVSERLVSTICRKALK